MKKELEIQLACFNLGDNLFAVDIMRIKEIIEPQKMASLPWISRFLNGVINLRGVVVPVMDMRKRFGMEPAQNRGEEKLLLVTLYQQLLALQVDDVHEVITVAAADIMPAPDVDDEPGAECLLGVCLSGGKLFMILDVDNLLAPGEVSELQLARG